MTDQSSSEQGKKIIIDEDWKAQVEAEKETLRKAQEGQAEPAAGAGQSPHSAAGPLPEPSLIALATSLAVQAMVAMGLVPDPMSGKTELQLDHARHFIDTIAMLQAKTEGNRTPEETLALEHLLHELRMGYVAVRDQGPAEE